MKNAHYALLLGIIVGCSGGGPAAQVEAVIPSWPELDALSSESVRSMVMGAEMGDWNAVKREAASPQIKALVDAFAATPVPDEFATDARKQAKEDAVKKWQALVAAASGTGNLQEAYKAAQESLAPIKVSDPVE